MNDTAQQKIPIAAGAKIPRQLLEILCFIGMVVYSASYLLFSTVRFTDMTLGDLDQSTFLWAGIFAALVALGLWNRLPWARWGAIFMVLAQTSYICIGTLEYLVDYHYLLQDAVAYFITDIPAIFCCLYAIAMLLMLTHPKVSAVYRNDRVLSRNVIRSVAANFVIGLGISVLLYGYTELQYFMHDLYLIWPMTASHDYYPRTFESCLFPTLIMICIASGFKRNESWVHITGIALMIVIVPYILLSLPFLQTDYLERSYIYIMLAAVICAGLSFLVNRYGWNHGFARVEVDA